METKLKAKQFIVVEKRRDTFPPPVYFYRLLPPGIHRLIFDSCCANYKTCFHAGKALCVEGNRWVDTDQEIVAVCDTLKQAKMVAKLLGVDYEVETNR